MSDFTVILYEVQQFGDSRGAFGAGSGRNFTGDQADYEFSCRNVDPDEIAVLTLDTFEVNSEKNVIQINGVALKDGFREGQGKKWVTHQLLVRNECNLQESGNVLHIESGDKSGGTGNIDDFILDNVVIWYKTSNSVIGVQQS
jgi:hypothetical protein